MPTPDPPRSPVESYLIIELRDRDREKKETLTIVRLPKLDESPVEPDLRLAVVHRHERRIERLWTGSRARQDPRVRPDEFDAFVFAHAVHPAYEHIRAQSRQDRVHRYPI